MYVAVLLLLLLVSLLLEEQLILVCNNAMIPGKTVREMAKVRKTDKAGTRMVHKTRQTLLLYLPAIGGYGGAVVFIRDGCTLTRL